MSDDIIGKKPGKRIFGNEVVSSILGVPGNVGVIAAEILGPAARPVRAILFDKSHETNWALGWHQDRTIAVRERIDAAGFGPWSVKSGTIHVEPPIEITRGMITMRLHLDDVDDQNAPLKISPGSHRLGRIPSEEINAVVAKLGVFTCLALSGDIWVYSTAILHASDAARVVRRRRVLQVDYAAVELPQGLHWVGIEA